MKKCLSWLLLFIIFASYSHAFSIKDIKFKPFSNIQINAGVVDNGYFPNNVSGVMALALRYKKDNLLIMYNLRNSGGSYSVADLNRFAEKSLDHIFIMKYMRPVRDYFTISTAIDYMKEFYQATSSENWGEGLFDFIRYGFSVTAGKKVGKTRNKLSLKYHVIKFPNYTDLLAEYMDTGGVDVEEKQDRHIFDIEAKTKASFFVNSSFGLKVSVTDYPSLFIIKETGEKDASNTQREMSYQIKMGVSKPLFCLLPSLNLTYKIKNSNQNYLFRESTSDTEVEFFENYYSYSQLNCGVGLKVAVFRWLDLTGYYSIENKQYASRKPRDSDGNFLTGQKMYISSNTLAFSINFKRGKNYIFSPEFLIKEQTSNEKYDALFKYNYKIIYVGIKVHISV